MVSEKKWYVGIDLGGTAIKLAIISENGDIAYKKETATNIAGGSDQILYQMNEMIGHGLMALQLTREQLEGIGLGAPGFMDLDKGYVYEAVNLGWKEYPLKERLQEITGLSVTVDNDGNTAALGELWKGAGQGSEQLLCITLGTGLGGGAILNGQIHHGARDTAGEIGHVTVMPDGGARCNCGKSGCIETIASATGIVRLALEALKGNKESLLATTLEENGKIEARDVAAAAEKGDPLALHIFDRVGYYLGLTLGNYAVLLNPEKIVIGGGVSKAGDILFNPIRQYYNEFGLTRLTGDIDIVGATLGNDAGVIGAAWLVHSKTI
jgi:glucokinase